MILQMACRDDRHPEDNSMHLCRLTQQHNRGHPTDFNRCSLLFWFQKKKEILKVHNKIEVSVYVENAWELDCGLLYLCNGYTALLVRCYHFLDTSQCSRSFNNYQDRCDVQWFLISLRCAEPLQSLPAVMTVLCRFTEDTFMLRH